MLDTKENIKKAEKTLEHFKTVELTAAEEEEIKKVAIETALEEGIPLEMINLK